MKTMSDWEEPENFEELLEKLYDGFPNGMLKDDIVEDIIVTREQRENLVEHGYLTREHHLREGDEFYYYNLGPNGLDLISSWRTEKLTRRMTVLTVLIAILTVVNIAVGLVQLV